MSVGCCEGESSSEGQHKPWQEKDCGDDVCDYDNDGTEIWVISHPTNDSLEDLEDSVSINDGIDDEGNEEEHEDDSNDPSDPITLLLFFLFTLWTVVSGNLRSVVVAVIRISIIEV